MIQVASRVLFACCVLVQAPALANSADTDWLLEEIRSQLENLTVIKTLGDCLDSSQCVSLSNHRAFRGLLSVHPSTPFTVRQFPTPEQPWFIDVARDGDVVQQPARSHPQWRDYSYRGTSLMQTVRSLERVSRATFWEREDMELFPTPRSELVAPLQSKRLSRSSALVN